MEKRIVNFKIFTKVHEFDGLSPASEIMLPRRLPRRLRGGATGNVTSGLSCGGSEFPRDKFLLKV